MQSPSRGHTPPAPGPHPRAQPGHSPAPAAAPPPAEPGSPPLPPRELSRVLSRPTPRPHTLNVQLHSTTWTLHVGQAIACRLLRPSSGGRGSRRALPSNGGADILVCHGRTFLSSRSCGWFSHLPSPNPVQLASFSKVFDPDRTQTLHLLDINRPLVRPDRQLQRPVRRRRRQTLPFLGQPPECPPDQPHRVPRRGRQVPDDLF